VRFLCVVELYVTVNDVKFYGEFMSPGNNKTDKTTPPVRDTQ